MCVVCVVTAGAVSTMLAIPFIGSIVRKVGRGNATKDKH